MTGPIRTIVAGSTFGQFYLAAIGRSDRFEPAGLLAQGSQRSTTCAARHGIALYRHPEQIPDDVDLVCVAVRSGAMGGSGSDLACDLLGRGFSVVQEQPVHHGEVAEAFRTARRHGVAYRVGDLYPHLPEVQKFTLAARRLLAAAPAEHVDAACAIQVAYPLVEILAAALGALHPWRLTAMPDAMGPFRIVTGTVADVPVTLRVHHEVDPDDPDNHLHLLHRITIATSTGSLTLVDTHGPVIWSPRLHVPSCVKNAFDFDDPDAAHLDEPSGTVLGLARPQSYRQSLSQVWPRAIAADLEEAAHALHGGPGRTEHAQLTLSACRAWQDLTAELGYPALSPGQRHVRTSSDDLVRVAANAGDA